MNKLKMFSVITDTFYIPYLKKNISVQTINNKALKTIQSQKVMIKLIWMKYERNKDKLA